MFQTTNQIAMFDDTRGCFAIARVALETLVLIADGSALLHLAA